MQFVGEVFLFLVKTHSLNLAFSYELQTCVAQVELCVFRCVTSVAHFFNFREFLYGNNKPKGEKIQKRIVFKSGGRCTNA